MVPLIGITIAIGLALVGLLWAAIAVRRRAIRTLLLTSGVEVAGRARLVTAARRGAPRIHVTYTDSDGVQRTVVKSIVSAGDERLVREPTRVVFHPRRTNRDDYVLVGFGATPRRWFPVSFARPRNRDAPAPEGRA